MTNAGFDRLAALVANCASAGVARQALLLRFDRLPASVTRPHHIRLAEAALAPLLRMPRAELFQLPGPCLAVAWRGEAEAALLDVIDGLEHLLMDPAGSTPALSDLLALYELPDTGDLLLDAFTDACRPSPEADAGPAIPLDPAFLTLLETCLAQADVARFARRQSVWRRDGPRSILAWEDRTLSIPELTDELAHGYDLQAEPWLFRRLTRTLDRRVLALLASPGELAAAGPFALRLNVSSLLGTDFLRFDAALPAALRGRVVIALSPADIVADARSMQFATGFAQARSYRTLLQLDAADLLPVMVPLAMEFDYLAIPWDDGLAGSTDGALAQHMPERLVLTGCDTSVAVEWGLASGVRLFTGAAANADASAMAAHGARVSA